MRITEQLQAIYKWLLSFLKPEWNINDYPLRFREKGKDNPDSPRWCAQIINWWVIAGLGETKPEAYKNLSESFEKAKKFRKHLPRPGVKVPLEFASGEELYKYRDVVSRIINEVLVEYDPKSVFISDGSNLWDFAMPNDISNYQVKIKEIFGVDVSHIESGNLVEISKYISENS